MDIQQLDQMKSIDVSEEGRATKLQELMKQVIWEEMVVREVGE